MQNKKIFKLQDIQRLIGDKNASVSAYYDAGFAPAYVATNEDMRLETALSMGNNKRVLTVAGSGDQALFYLLAGAQHIDTYDMTFCAKVIQDIKFAAIRQQVPYQDYIKILQELPNRSDPMTIAYMPHIVKDMPADTASFIKNIKSPILFSMGLTPNTANYQTSLTPDEYVKLQAMRPNTPSFIWSNIADLHHNIHGKYDVINTSNIFDYVPELLTPVLNNMRPHMTTDGIIITESNSPRTYDAILHARDTYANQLKFGTAKKRTNLICIQNTR